MKTLNMLALGVALSAALKTSAISYTPDYLPPPVVQSQNPDDAQIANELIARGIISSATELGSLIYKSDDQSSLFSMSIQNTDPPAGEETATLTYDGPGHGITFIIVKDGTAGFTMWDGRELPVLNSGDALVVDNRDLWHNDNEMADISHIAIYGLLGSPGSTLGELGSTGGSTGGTTGGGTNVPDQGETAILLGCGLLGLTVMSRRTRA